MGRKLIFYDVFLMGIAFVAVMYNPHSGTVGFYAPAKTALLSGSICGGLSILWGILLNQQKSWAWGGAVVSLLLFTAAFTWRAIAGWQAFAAGQSEKWFAALLISLMWTASVWVLIQLFRYRSLGRQSLSHA